MATESPLLFGKYQLLERVARGGMAEVFKAKSYGVEGFEKLVVLKRILPDLAQNQQFVDMFLNEARLSVALSHANIVQVFDLGREEDTYFIAMEYVLGMDFAQALRVCRKTDQLAPVEISVFVACEVARALDYAHRRRDALGRQLGVVHRDISPQNVLLSFEGEVKVTDFGIAKARTTIEEQGTVKGKYAYMAPEQATGRGVDARADIYALGVTLYEALAGRNPYAGFSPFETVRRVREGDRPLLLEANPDVPEELARIVESAMALDPDARQPAAARLYEDLSAFLYTTGKRVGPHDLAEWLQTLRGPVAAPKAEDPARLGDALGENLRESVLPEEPRGPRGGSSPGRTPGSGSGLSRPHVEVRDVTLVALEVTISHTFAGSPDALDGLLPVATRYGAVVLDQGPSHLVLVFGLQSPDGHDTETATRCALKLHAAAARALAGATVGAGVHPARIHIGVAGTAERDDLLTSAVAAARALAVQAGTDVVASAAVKGLVGELFELAALEAGGEAGGEAGDALRVAGEKAAGRRKVVGRKEQFKQLGEILAAAASAGLQLVSVVGEAGVGKTRLLEETLYRLRRMNHRVTWYTATGLSHDRDVPFSALQSMLRVILGIDETDPESVAREKARRLRELGLNPQEMMALGVVLGVVSASAESLSAPSRPLRSAVTRIATRLAEDQLTVLVWDAAEHLDEQTQAMLEDLLRGAERARVAVVLAARPGRSFPWDGAANQHVITLGPLAEDEAQQLMALRLGAVTALPPDLVDDLWVKSAGNPLYLEEYLKALVESGAVEVREDRVAYRRAIAEVGVPKTLRGLVASRVASLTAPQRRLLQVAAVFGPRFALDPLVDAGDMEANTAEGALGALVERGLVVPAAGGEYGFAHDLVREVMYEGLTLETRRQLHAGVAVALERLYPDRLDEMAERLAYHHREAGDRAGAVRFLERAARRLTAEQAFDAAAAVLGRAIELAQAAARPDPDQVLRLYTAFGGAALGGRRGGVALEKVRLGIAYAEELGDAGAILPLLVVAGRLLAREHRGVEAVQQLERALALAGEGTSAGDGAGRVPRATIVSALGGVHADHGEFGKALPYLEEAVRLAEAAGLETERAYALTALASCQSAAGDRELALTSLDRVVTLAEAGAAGGAGGVTGGGRALRVEIERTRAGVHFHDRDFTVAAQVAAGALELAREASLPYEVSASASSVGEALLRLGDFKRAFAAFKEAHEVAEEHGFARLAVLTGAFLAFIDAVGVGGAGARAAMETALAGLDAEGTAGDALRVRYLLGLVCRERGEVDDARRYLRDALALARSTENRMYLEDCEAALRDLGPGAGS